MVRLQTVLGDGATVKTSPLINVNAEGPKNPGCVLGIIDCTEHMSEGGVKDADYIARQTLALVQSLDPDKKLVDLVLLFECAGNVQKAGHIFSQYIIQDAQLAIALPMSFHLSLQRFLN